MTELRPGDRVALSWTANPQHFGTVVETRPAYVDDKGVSFQTSVVIDVDEVYRRDPFDKRRAMMPESLELAAPPFTSREVAEQWLTT